MNDDTSGQSAVERLQGALAAAGLASWILIPETGRLAWNEEGFEAASWRPSDLFSSLETWLQRIHPEDRPGAAETLETARRVLGRWCHDHRIVLPGSDIVRCRVAAQVHTDQGGGPGG